MSSSDAQRSPVHQSTEDSSVEPTGPMAPPSVTPPPPPGRADAGRAPDPDAMVRNDPDESSFGGPLKIDDPDAGNATPGAPGGAEGRRDDE